MLLVDDNDITGGAQHVCDSVDDLNRFIMSADSPLEYNCSCCVYNCSNKAICYVDEDLASIVDLVYDDKFSVSSTYARDMFILQ